MQFERKTITVDKNFEGIQVKIVKGEFPQQPMGGLDHVPDHAITFTGNAKQISNLIGLFNMLGEDDAEAMIFVEDVPWYHGMAVVQEIVSGRMKSFDLDLRVPVKEVV